MGRPGGRTGWRPCSRRRTCSSRTAPGCRRRGDVDLAASERVGVGAGGGGQLDQFDIVLTEPGLVQHSQDQRSLRLAGGERDAPALQSASSVTSTPGRRPGRRSGGSARRRGRRRPRSCSAARSSSPGADAGHRPEVECPGPERRPGPGATGDVGEPDLEGAFVDQARQFEGDPRLRVTDDQGGSLEGASCGSAASSARLGPVLSSEQAARDAAVGTGGMVSGVRRLSSACWGYGLSKRRGRMSVGGAAAPSRGRPPVIDAASPRFRSLRLPR